MGRECRRVPAGWEHPVDERGNHRPLHDQTHAEAMADWNRQKELFKVGKRLNFEGVEEDLDMGGKVYTFEEWHGEAPDPRYYRPEYEGEPTHYQMYENTTEGTPKSPVFETAEECARWCADHGVSAFADMAGDYNYWMRVIEGSAGFGMLVNAANRTMIPA